jgi:hypothetical protein
MESISNITLSEKKHESKSVRLNGITMLCKMKRQKKNEVNYGLKHFQVLQMQWLINGVIIF